MTCAGDVSSHWRDFLTKLLGDGWNFQKLYGEYDLTLLAEHVFDVSRIVKIMRPEYRQDDLEMIIAAHRHISAIDASIPLPDILEIDPGRVFVTGLDETEAPRLIWFTTVVKGRPLTEMPMRPASMLEDLGRLSGRIAHALRDFSHPRLERPLKWNLAQSDWITNRLNVITSEDDRAALDEVIQDLPAWLELLAQRPHQATHNDLNDANLFWTRQGERFVTTGVIDLGDMVRAPVVCDLAILCAYTLMGSMSILKDLIRIVQAFHTENPLDVADIAIIWPLIRLRLAVSVVNSGQMKQRLGDDPYVTISEAPAWQLLHAMRAIDPAFVEIALRVSCGYPATNASPRIMRWLAMNRGTFSDVHGISLNNLPRTMLSVRDSVIPVNPRSTTRQEAFHDLCDGDEAIGLYGEPRLIYTGSDFCPDAEHLTSQRTVHLGVDVFQSAGTSVSAPLDARIYRVENRPFERDYGGMVVLEHITDDGDVFHTLYGHLDPDSIRDLVCGQKIGRGEHFAQLGVAEVNGGWKPHLHFQILLSLAGSEELWPGVADPDLMSIWMAICPNPAVMLNLDDHDSVYVPIEKPASGQKARPYFAGNLKLSYRQPLTLLRGSGCWLFDEWGRPHLDAYNNVPHVGHAHPRIRAAAARQLSLLNTNTRYHHPAQGEFAKALLEKAPKGMEVVFLVNSGSEANELALRLARTHTASRDIVVQAEAYHGMTNAAVEISPYKFAKPGGIGQSDWVHVVPVPDLYHQADALSHSVQALDLVIQDIDQKGSGLCGFIAETFPSVAGQIIPPEGYLESVYRKIRQAGGVCMADEVQTGLGRLGDYYWGIDAQGVVPDIMVLGKPLGCGHPLGAVLTTREIADSFDNGIEYFSTFGGSTLSCVIGREVLRIVDDEGLQDNARKVGDVLMDALRELAQRHPAIGDVRGMGLFIGVELVEDPETKRPATELAGHIVNALRHDRILIGTEGPADNVLKIRPPLCIRQDEALIIAASLDRHLSVYT